MHHLVTQLALHLALDAIGLSGDAMPQILPDSGYVPIEKRCDGVHITVSKDCIKHHEYSSDLREWPYFTFTYGSLEAFIRRYTDYPIDRACTSYMATTGRESLQKVFMGGDTQDFLAKRQQLRSELDHRLDTYLNSIPFRLLNQLMQL